MPRNSYLDGNGLSHLISKIKNDSAINNSNLLDNWYLADAINQRGNRSYTQPGYGVDRFYATGEIRVVSDGYVELVNNTENTHYWVQKLPNEIFNNLHGRTLTLSLIFSTMSAGIFIYFGYQTSTGYVTIASSQELTTDGGLDLVEVSGVIPNAELTYWEGFGIALPAGADIILEAVKLELGPQQTLAHKEGEAWTLNDPPPNKAIELLKCQRFYRRYGAGLTGLVQGNTIVFTFSFNEQMYKYPTATLLTNFIPLHLGDSDYNIENATIGLQLCNKNGVIYIVVSGTFLASPPNGAVLRYNSEGDLFEISAEL